MTNVTGITSTSYNLNGLTALTNYTVYVQSVKGDKTSEWSRVNFNTTNDLHLYDDQYNSTVLAISIPDFFSSCYISIASPVRSLSRRSLASAA